jgi:hypothetical protein
MKGKNSPRKHNKLSFVVDRDEIDINSDWVSAVLRSPVAEDRTARDSRNLPSNETSGGTTVETSAPVVANATVVDIATVVKSASVAINNTVVKIATDKLNAPVRNFATVEVAREEETAANPDAVAENAVRKSGRRQKPRRIRTILDGLTPGQFTVYSLMWQRGQPAGEGKRLYAGGYSALCDLTGMSKRGIQNVVGELQRKGPISIHQAPGYHRTQFSIYQVLGENEVLALWKLQGYQFALGKGKELISTVAL